MTTRDAHVSYDCNARGHVWLETDGTHYQRTRGRSQASATVTCAHCPATREMQRHAKYSGPRPPGMPVDHSIPPGIKAALDRAVKAAAHDGPVPKP